MTPPHPIVACEKKKNTSTALAFKNILTWAKLLTVKTPSRAENYALSICLDVSAELLLLSKVSMKKLPESLSCNKKT